MRRISVDSFGFGGANSHVIIDDAFHTIEALGIAGNHRTLTSPSLAIGLNGVNGTNGVHKTKALNGTNGVNGKNGVHKTNGVNGTNGVDGTKGVHEIHAVNGTNGLNGTNGVHEIDGVNGTNGVNGINGLNGSNEVHRSNGVNGVTASKSIKSTPGYQLMTWSARDEAALKRMLHLYDGYLKVPRHDDTEFLGDLAYTLAARRTLMAWRAFSVVDEQGKLEILDLTTTKCERAARDVGVAFVFTGQGAQYANMGMKLIRYPVFKAKLIEVDEIFKEAGAEWSLFGKHRVLLQVDVR